MLTRRSILPLTLASLLTITTGLADERRAERDGQRSREPERREPVLRPGEVHVDFPLGAQGDQVRTSWKVRYRIDPRHGLGIVGAWLKRPGENPPWLKVVEDLHVTHLYVPYADNSHRYYDMDKRWFPQHGPWKMDELAIDRANLLGSAGKFLDDYTVREDRDAGLLWLYNDANWHMEKQYPGERLGRTFAYRRQEMVLWGVYQASNYFYIFQYAFHNDGTIVCRLGSTGKNLYGHSAKRGGGHMHNALWRVQLDLGGTGPDAVPKRLAKENLVDWIKHEETSDGRGEGETKKYPIKQEQGYEWKAEEFTAFRFTNPEVKNSLDRPVSYDFVPLRYGSARHFSPPWVLKGKGLKFPNDEFARKDFWITNNDPQYTDYRELPGYVQDEKTLGGNPVLWHISSNLHVPRDEDFVGPKERRDPGCATVMFSGFELRPRSVFRDTPFLTPGKKKQP